MFAVGPPEYEPGSPVISASTLAGMAGLSMLIVTGMAPVGVGASWLSTTVLENTPRI